MAIFFIMIDPTNKEALNNWNQKGVERVMKPDGEMFVGFFHKQPQLYIVENLFFISSLITVQLTSIPRS